MQRSVVLLLLVALACGVGFAQNAKVTARVDKLAVIQTAAGPVDLSNAVAVAALPWNNILVQNLRIASQKDLFIDASLECALYTFTKVSTSAGVVDTESADAGMRVRVGVWTKGGTFVKWAQPDAGLLLGNPADPATWTGNTATGSGVSYCRRFQQLSAKLQGIITLGCLDADPLTPCTALPEEIELVLSTLDSHSFNFVVEDLAAGEYIVRVQAVGITANTTDGKAAAVAGAGSVTVEEVRLIKNEDVVIQ